jgi:hypothetical protein
MAACASSRKAGLSGSDPRMVLTGHNRLISARFHPRVELVFGWAPILSYRTTCVRLQAVLEMAAAIALSTARRPNKTTSTERKMMSLPRFESDLITRD